MNVPSRLGFSITELQSQTILNDISGAITSDFEATANSHRLNPFTRRDKDPHFSQNISRDLPEVEIEDISASPSEFNISQNNMSSNQ